MLKYPSETVHTSYEYETGGIVESASQTEVVFFSSEVQVATTTTSLNSYLTQLVESLSNTRYTCTAVMGKDRLNGIVK